MRLNTIGQALLIVAILLGAAGIAEPNAGTSAAFTIATFVGFAIIVWQSHEAWAAGYRDAQLDVTVAKQDEKRPLRDSLTLFKCGQVGCYCKDDLRFAVPHD